MDRLADIALFLRVLDLGSIRGRGAHLGLSTAVASKRLQRLEQEPGVRLLHRTTASCTGRPKGWHWRRRGGCWWKTWMRSPPACARAAPGSPVPW